ncbi:MAG: AAA family ATPase [Candidatus Methylacidiphilales bacterium]
MTQLETTYDESPASDAVLFAQKSYQDVQTELAKVIVGQNDVIEQVMISVFSRNHALLVGVPGLAKTLLISSLAQAMQMSFRRIQFTPDLMPSDITGTEVINTNPTTGEKEFRFLEGPLFSNIVLADEINRTPPKTQAAMLEAMQERRVTVGGKTFTLPAPFFVLATQNPIDQEGTYPLPEAQMDRFLFLISVDYPETEEELEVMRRGTGSRSEPIVPVLDAESVIYIQEAVKQMPVADHVLRYAQRIAACTRTKREEALPVCKKYLSYGAGPRASLGLITAAKTHALMRGQSYTDCENVAAVAPSIMRHRVACNFIAQGEGVTTDDIVREIISTIPQNEAQN